jgi:hypothetical protein
VATEGIEGLYVETKNYGATAAFWKSLGYQAVVETEHGSGQWVNPSGGPYVFIAERQEPELAVQPILKVADADSFAPVADRPLDYQQPFLAQHWGVVEAIVTDPDGRSVSLQAPGPASTSAPASAAEG